MTTVGPGPWTNGSGRRLHRPPTRSAGHLEGVVGPASPLDDALRRETWGRVGFLGQEKTVFPTCAACDLAGRRPPGFVWMN
jgi:hypothetical protein